MMPVAEGEAVMKKILAMSIIIPGQSIKGDWPSRNLFKVNSLLENTSFHGHLR